MDIRYQVFVSSTYEDLQEERAEVMQALLELDCMPAGMELFPAASEEQWKWIKRVISESDYYMVIVGGKYGSVQPDTLRSYTEMEYDYAIEIGKPTIAFIIDKAVSLPESKIELDLEKRHSLDAFKDKTKTRLCKFWINTSDLGAKVSRSITQLIKREPAIGWVRANALSQADSEETLRLKNKVLELEQLSSMYQPHFQVDNAQEKDTLAQGTDEFVVHANLYREFSETSSETPKRKDERIGTVSLSTTWDEISNAVAKALITRSSHANAADTLVRSMEKGILKEGEKTFGPDLIKDGNRIRIYLVKTSRDQIKIQFMALGLISIDTESARNLYEEPVEFWVPTAEGTRYFVRRLALKRSLPPT